MPTEYLESRGISYEKDYDTSRLSSIRCGGKAAVIAYPKTRDELTELISFSQGRDIKYVIIGKCTNSYFSDNGFDGLIVSTSRLSSMRFYTASVTADCGCSLRSVIHRAMERGLDLAPELSGIPGSVGGAVRMNAGAYGRCVGELVSWVEVFDPITSQTAVLSREEMQFAYRSSLAVSKKLVIIAANFELKNSAREIVLSRIAEFSRKRAASAPKFASLGSFFKAFPEVPASRLIDLAGMKGERIGDAAVYDRHAGYIINMGRATAAEINALADRVEEAVYNKFGKRLVREVEFYE